MGSLVGKLISLVGAANRGDGRVIDKTWRTVFGDNLGHGLRQS